MQNAVVDAEFIERLPELKLIAVFGAGYDRVDIAAARRRGIAVANTPGVTDAAVADMAMALLLATARQVCAADRFVRAGRWPHGRFPLVPQFSGRRLGIFGLGRIGEAIAKRAIGFDLEIGYHNRRRQPELPYRYFDGLAALAAWSDYLVVACPATPDTRGRVDAEVLQALGRAGILVNIARGSIIDENALVGALESRAIAGAGLDVFEHEPEVPAALTGRDDVVLTPHVAGGTLETWRAAEEAVIANLVSFFETGRPLTPVDFAREPAP